MQRRRAILARTNAVAFGGGCGDKPRMLSITDISVRIAGRLLIDHGTAQIVPGARVGLVGRNGTGKSTLFKAIRGELPTESGTIADPAALARRQPRAGGAERPGKPDRGRAQGRPRARRAAARGRHRARSAPDRGNPDPAGRHRRPFGAGARGGDPQRPRLFDRGSGAALLGILRRLADARRARRDPVRRARPSAARRADQLSRPRRHALARGPSGELSAHRDRHQPRPRPARHLGRPDPASRSRQAHALPRQLFVVRGAARQRAKCSTPSRPSGRRPNASACRPSSTASRPRPRRRARPSRA